MAQNNQHKNSNNDYISPEIFHDAALLINTVTGNVVANAPFTKTFSSNPKHIDDILKASPFNENISTKEFKELVQKTGLDQKISNITIKDKFFDIYINSPQNTDLQIWQFKNVTKIVQCQENETEQKSRFTQILQNTADFLLIINENTEIIYASPSVKETIGYNPKDLIGRIALNMVHKADLRAIIKSIEKTILTKENIWFPDFKFKHADGSWINLEATGQNQTNVPPFNGIILSIRDITDRKTAERDLYLNHYAVDTNSNPTFWADYDGRLIYVNEAMCHAIDYNCKELLKRSVFDIDEFLTKEQWELEWRRTQQNNYTKRETIFLKRDGEKIPVEISWNYVFYESNEYLFGFIKDLSLQKKAEREKDKLEEQLRRSQRLESIAILAGGIAHDFNNILAPMLVYTEMAMDEIDESERIYNDLNHVLNGVHRAKDLVHQLLTFSRQDEQNKHPIQIQFTIKEAIKLLKRSFKANISIVEKINPHVEKIVADPSQIHQVLINLVTNATQALGKNGGEITVTIDQVMVNETGEHHVPELSSDEYCYISIKDNGPGIPQNVIDRIFEPFFTTKNVNEGTGLGLAVVHGIINAHEGVIQVESNSENGTNFQIYLPLFKEDEPDHIDKDAIEIYGGNENILFVDDDAEVLLMGYELLKRLGYNVKTEKDSLKALETVKENPTKFDLIITDQDMPNLTGIQLIKQLLKINRKMPIILISGLADDFDTVLMIKNVEFIRKPVNRHEIGSTIRKLLGQDSQPKIRI